MAISGAAQSPNEGSHTSPSVAALLTLFNIRLGWWLGNPRHENTRYLESPKDGPSCVMDELLAQAGDDGRFVYLSDGGHFENLGIYELVRRRCKLIIAGDADSDPKYAFDDLINAIQLCQADFGVTITIDTDPLQNSGPSNWSRSAFTVGLIRYGADPKAAGPGSSANADGLQKLEELQNYGILIYLKSAVTRHNSITIKNYDRDSKEFPHEPTINQFFDQTQFEAYRLLGLETTNEALDKLGIKPFSPGYRDASTPSWWNPKNVVNTEWTKIQEKVQKILLGGLQ